MNKFNSYSFAFLLLLLGFSSVKAQEGDRAKLPFFKVAATSGMTISPELLPKNRPVIVFYFDPDCDHCEQQATWVKEQINRFNGVSLVWISWGEMDAIKGFQEKHFADVNKRDMVFTKDTEYNMDNWFGYSEVPSVYVYNQRWERTASFKSETIVSDLISATKIQ